jgi:hypothetical protein
MALNQRAKYSLWGMREIEYYGQYMRVERIDMNTLRQMLTHPAGRIGLTVGLTLGFLAAVMGETSKALLFAGLCRFLARRIAR